MTVAGGLTPITQDPAWRALEAHREEVHDTHLRE